jgi:hypothetical protein
MKVFAWILTAAAILIGADVFVMSPDEATLQDATTLEAPATYGTMEGGNGFPPDRN